jgi:hypothetical protein
MITTDIVKKIIPSFNSNVKLLYNLYEKQEWFYAKRINYLEAKGANTEHDKQETIFLVLDIGKVGYEKGHKGLLKESWDKLVQERKVPKMTYGQEVKYGTIKSNRDLQNKYVLYKKLLGTALNSHNLLSLIGVDGLVNNKEMANHENKEENNAIFIIIILQYLQV